MTTGRGAVVELRNVTKRYAHNTDAAGAVNDLSLTVPAGEICVLVGPSGCGKTTTLRMVNRLVEPTSGQVLIDGSDVATVEPTQLRRRIGYVIQQIGLFPHQSIARNVATVPSLLGWEKKRSEERVDELLSLVGLNPGQYRNRYPAELSGGERQRVGVARALAAEPPVMLMDEPFGAVDPIVRERLQDEFLRLHETLGMTVMLVTHDIDEAIKMGTRVAVMRQGGYLEQYAPPGDLLAHPASDFVAQFVGADRALKHLSLLTVRDLTPLPLTCLADVRMASSNDHPRFPADTLLRDALSELLVADEQIGVIVGNDGAAIGAVTLESIAAALADRRSAPATHTPDVGQTLK
jgi:osmoprotectant transport system ATP-binding protein